MEGDVNSSILRYAGEGVNMGFMGAKRLKLALLSPTCFTRLNVKLLLIVSSVWIFYAFQEPLHSKDRVIFDRIVYLYNLKALIGQGVWKDFSDKKFDLPLVYYTDSLCFIANPTDKFVSTYKAKLVFKRAGLKIYQTRLIDQAPFHMETSMTFGKTDTAYNYRFPFMNCSSFEVARKTVNDLNTTEQWATMVMHEYFHGFQFRHPGHLAYFEKNIAISSDTLRKLYKNYPWFKESIDKENTILLALQGSVNRKQTASLIDSFFLIRDQRRMHARNRLSADISLIEQCYETMEGTARHVEYSLYDYFANKTPDRNLASSDSAYRSYQYFRNYKIEKDQWLYLTDKTPYFYATGFNLTRLMEKLKLEYQSTLFNESGLSLESVLRQVRQNRYLPVKNK